MYHTMVKRVFFEPSCFRARPFPRLPRAPYAALKPSLNDKMPRMSCHRHWTTTVMYRPRGHHQSRAILARTRCRLSEIKTEISCRHPRRALAFMRGVRRNLRYTCTTTSRGPRCTPSTVAITGVPYENAPPPHSPWTTSAYLRLTQLSPKLAS